MQQHAETDEQGFKEGQKLVELGATICAGLMETLTATPDPEGPVRAFDPAQVAAAERALRIGTDMCRQACLAAIFRNGLPKDLGVQRVLPSGNDKPQLPDSRHVNGAVDWGERPEKPDSGRATRSGSSEETLTGPRHAGS